VLAAPELSQSERPISKITLLKFTWLLSSYTTLPNQQGLGLLHPYGFPVRNLQSTCLKKVIVALLPRFVVVMVVQSKATVLVDWGQGLDDVIMEAIKGYHKRAHTWWLEQKSLVGENVLFQKTVLKLPNWLLLFRISAVQRG
jgi:hypothetical protein